MIYLLLNLVYITGSSFTRLGGASWSVCTRDYWTRWTRLLGSWELRDVPCWAGGVWVYKLQRSLVAVWWLYGNKPHKIPSPLHPGKSLSNLVIWDPLSTFHNAEMEWNIFSKDFLAGTRSPKTIESSTRREMFESNSLCRGRFLSHWYIGTSHHSGWFLWLR
jgi:hypothetical protein